MQAEVPRVKSSFDKMLAIDKPIEKLVKSGYSLYIIENEVGSLYDLAKEAEKDGDSKTAKHARMFAEDHVKNAEKREESLEKKYISPRELLDATDRRLVIVEPFLQRIKDANPSYWEDDSLEDVLHDILVKDRGEVRILKRQYDEAQVLIAERAPKERLHTLIPALVYPEVCAVLDVYGLWEKVDPDTMSDSFGYDPVDEWQLPIKE